MECFRVRWNSSNPRSLQSCLATWHDFVQQVSSCLTRKKINFANTLKDKLIIAIYCYSADPQYSSAVINTNVIVSHTGEVVWLSHGIFRSSCDINVEFFPFDEQRCVLKWASWTYDGYQVSSTFYILHLTLNDFWIFICGITIY